MSNTDSHSHLSIQERLKAARLKCEAEGRRFTPLRAHVFELIIENDGVIKAYDLLSRIRPELGSPKPPTVYRALEFLTELGLVHRVEALNAFIACDHNHAGHLAEFFICELCHSVEERHAHDHTDCKPEGFVINRSVVEHYGDCGRCTA